MSLEGNMNEIPGNNNEYFVPDLNFLEFEDNSNLDNNAPNKIEAIIFSEKEPVLSDNLTPQLPRKGEIRHWNRHLLDVDPQLKEEPTPNSLLSHRNQALIERAKKRLAEEQVSLTDEQVAENLPPEATNTLREHVKNRGFEEYRISGGDVVDAEGNVIGTLDNVTTDGGLEETEHRVYNEQLEQVIDKAKERLTDIEREVVENYTMQENVSLSDASSTLHLTKRKILDANEKAARKLRHPSSGLLDFVRDSDDFYTSSDLEQYSDFDDTSEPNKGDFETPVLRDGIAPITPIQAEQRHWNRLLQNEGLMHEEPTENLALTREQQDDLDKAVRKLHKDGIDNPTDEQITDEIPPTKAELKEFIGQHGTIIEDIDDIATEIPAFDDGGLEQAENRVFQEQLQAKLSEAKATTTDREWAIVEALNGSVSPSTLTDLSQAYGISDTRVKHLNKTTLLRLRNQDNGLASFVGDYSGELKEAAVSSFEFPSNEQVPLNDPRDKRPYSERIQDYCEQDTLEWISREREAIEQNPGTLTKLNAGIDTVNQEMDTLKETQRRILMRATDNDHFSNPDLIAANIRIFKLDAWKYELEGRKQKHIDETARMFRRFPRV